MNSAAGIALAILCYSVQPTPYLTEHAAKVRGLYDGFFFTAGSWDGGVVARIGLDGQPATQADWLPLATRNVAALRAAGVTENLLAVSFNDDDPWPSAETLLDTGYTAKMGRHFRALGKAAKSAGFRGVSIDVEYPYPRYELDHPIYTYEGYSPPDLMNAAYAQGRASMSGALDEFPDAVVWVLPGSFRTRPFERQYMLGLLDEMAERDAPGGFHLGTEHSYCLHDPVTQVAITRQDDPIMPDLVSAHTLDYWKRRCTIAPGVWPSHMVETGAPDYPVRPWPEELAELRQQMRILRTTAKRYLWSFSGQPIWYRPDRTSRRLGLTGATYPGVDTLVAGWHEILREKKAYPEMPDADPRMTRLIDAVRRFDAGALDGDGLAETFGTPGTWHVLGPLANPYVSPARLPDEALLEPVRTNRVYWGKDGAVRWGTWHQRDPRGTVECRRVFDYLMTDSVAAYFTTWIESDVAREVVFNVNWDDGMTILLDSAVVFSEGRVPPRGHGLLFRDRYHFERAVPVRVPAGRSRLSVMDYNNHGVWGFNFRIADADGYPVPGIRFVSDAVGNR